MWTNEFAKQCQATAERNMAQQVPIFQDMPAGEGLYKGIDQHLNFDIATFAQISATVNKACI